MLVQNQVRSAKLQAVVLYVVGLSFDVIASLTTAAAASNARWWIIYRIADTWSTECMQACRLYRCKATIAGNSSYSKQRDRSCSPQGPQTARCVSLTDRVAAHTKQSC